jgi:hypothetical protein
MLGFIHRLYIEHDDDKEDPLVDLQLHCLCAQTGVFKAGKSYVIRGNTKSGCWSQFEELVRLERNLHDPKSFKIAYGSYTRKQHTEWYSYALGAYINKLTKLDDAYYLITDLDKKIGYLEGKLRQLRPDWKSILSCLTLMPGGEFVKFYSRE